MKTYLVWLKFGACSYVDADEVEEDEHSYRFIREGGGGGPVFLQVDRQDHRYPQCAGDAGGAEGGVPPAGGVAEPGCARAGRSARRVSAKGMALLVEVPRFTAGGLS